MIEGEWIRDPRAVIDLAAVEVPDNDYTRAYAAECAAPFSAAFVEGYVDLVDESLNTGEPRKLCTPIPCGIDDRDVMPDLTGFVVDDGG